MAASQVRRAVLSVSDKSGLLDFAQRLHAAGVELFSTGGTRKHLEDAGVPVRDIAEYTEFPEMLDGRVKTLHPKIFAGILCRHDRPDDMVSLDEYGCSPFELVVVNLYPFEQTIAKPETTLPQAIEQIDVGGPSMVRAAAKNHAFVAVATSPLQYAEIIGQIEQTKSTDDDLRRRLALAAFQHTAAYDSAIAAYLSSRLSDEPFPAILSLSFRRSQTLRYGENPHQSAAFYVESRPPAGCLATAEQLNGKELSYNNLLDLDNALALARALPDAAAVVVKHNNPCGAASADQLAAAFQSAYDGDPLSAFGGIVACNRMVDADAAALMAAPGKFLEAIVAPCFSPEALEILKTKPTWGPNVRLLAVGEAPLKSGGWDFRRIDGGLLVQDRDLSADPEADWIVATAAAPTAEQMDDLRFAWEVVRHVKSNAITVAKGRMLLGAGAGQMSRVDSVEISLKKAGDRVQGSVMASDAFFPFADSVHAAAAAGVKALIQPGGSKRDPEVIAAANEHGLSMIFTGRRHFKH